MISKIKEGLDLGSFDQRELELMYKSEIYIDIDSEFAEEIKKELNSRKI